MKQHDIILRELRANPGKWYVSSIGNDKMRKLNFGEIDDLLDWAADSLKKEGKKNAWVKQTGAFNDELDELLDDSFIDQKPKRKTATTKKAKPSRVHK